MEQQPQTPQSQEADRSPDTIPAAGEVGTEQEQLRDKFKSAARLGRDVLTETDTRKKRLLAPFLDSRQFFPEDKQALASHQGEFSAEDIEEVKRASFAISLQAASQIEEANIRQTPQALKKDIVRDELNSLQKMDKMLEGGFRSAQRYIKEGNAAVVIQEAKKILSVKRNVPVDSVEISDQGAIQWVQDTIQSGGQRLRKQQRLAQDFLQKR